MNWNDHYKLRGAHAFLSASKYHWINYDREKLIETYSNFQSAQKGTELHDIASKLIDNRIKLPRKDKTLNLYVNDGIRYKMRTEQPLVYSLNCFGTADAICFRKKHLQIHDLKTGSTPASMNQLEIYAALFCLEYDQSPEDISTELRIYQNNEVLIHSPEPAEIDAIIAKIVDFDEIIDELKSGEE